ncbi:MAG: cyclase family protein, partial [Rhodospirillaceae bacterium]|nr:cyclase family protein [Rhodospirillaceae bacterium]
GGACVSDIPVSQFFGRGHLIDARGHDRITGDLLNGVPLEDGDIVLVLTGRYKLFREPDYYRTFPEVDSTFADRLVEAKVAILGLDTPSPDTDPFPVHHALLSQNILLVENLNNLEALLGISAFHVTAIPAKLRCDGAPVRVVATAP